MNQKFKGLSRKKSIEKVLFKHQKTL